MTLRLLAILTLGLALGLSLLGCETATDDNIEAVRVCVNSASKNAYTNPAAAATQATTCQNMMGTLAAATPQGNTLNFTITLLQYQKFNQIAQMATLMGQASPGGHQGSMGALPVLILANPGPHASGSDITTAATLVTTAQASGSSGLQLLAGLINAATVLDSLNNFAGGNDAFTSLQACAAGTNCTGAQQATIAQALVVAAAGACSGSSSSSSMCTQVKACTGGNFDPSTINAGNAAALLNTCKTAMQ